MLDAVAGEHDEVRLEGGNITTGVVRVGNTVRRPVGHWSPLVHAVLRHLEAEGFSGAPQLLGTDERGREVLTFCPGVAMPDAPEIVGDDEGLARMARLARAFHRAVASFQVPAGATWWAGSVDPAGGDQLLHGDLGPWNVIVGPDGWTIIDWDAVSPGRLEWELAYMLHTFVPLWPESGLSDGEVVHRVGVFAEAYGLSSASLTTALDLVPARCLKVAASLRAEAAKGDAAFVRLLEDGHASSWTSAGNYVSSRIGSWRRLLGSRGRMGG
jgi:hypothetical protein